MKRELIACKCYQSAKQHCHYIIIFNYNFAVNDIAFSYTNKKQKVRKFRF